MSIPEFAVYAMQVGLPLRAVRGISARAITRPELLDYFKLGQANPAIISEEQIAAATRMVGEIEELRLET